MKLTEGLLVIVWNIWFVCVVLGQWALSTGWEFGLGLKGLGVNGRASYLDSWGKEACLTCDWRTNWQVMRPGSEVMCQPFYDRGHLFCSRELRARWVSSLSPPVLAYGPVGLAFPRLNPWLHHLCRQTVNSRGPDAWCEINLAALSPTEGGGSLGSLCAH